MEEQIIDATTEEGQAALKQFEEHEKVRLAEKASISGDGTNIFDNYAGDPE